MHMNTDFQSKKTAAVPLSSWVVSQAAFQRLSAWARFYSALAGAMISLYLFAVDRITFPICLFQVSLFLFVFIYNGLSFFEIQNHSWLRHIVLLHPLLDTIVLTFFIVTFVIMDVSLQSVHILLFPAYFVIVSSTLLYGKKWLPLMTGILALSAASVLGALSSYFFGAATIGNGSFLYVPGVCMLLCVAIINELAVRKGVRQSVADAGADNEWKSMGALLPFVFFRLDTKGTFVWLSDTAEDCLGMVPEKVIGHALAEYIEDSDRFSLDKLPVRETFRVKNFSHDIQFVDCVIEQKQGVHDTAVLQGSMVDVTERELAILQREEMEQQLFQYKKMESLGTLASGMAHDFNNIMQTVTDISDRIRIETREERTIQNIDLIKDTLVDAQFLVSELFALGRKKPLTYNSLDITGFLREIVPLYDEQLGDSYTVNLNVSNEKLTIQGDEEYLKRVFQNLVGNARDAMPEGGIITIDCFSVKNDDSDRYVVLRFSDTGVGISDKSVDKIFDPFYTTKKKGKGTGLGLALVRRIITLHKGYIGVEKSDHQGTTFRIEFPESGTNTKQIDTKFILAHRLTTAVLVLDDDPKIRKILNFFLVDLSYKTYEAANMKEGVQLLQEHKDECRVVVMDWKLKDDDPHEAIRRFREIREDLIVIVVSGYAPQSASINSMKIFRWLTKPYDKNKLDLEIQKALYLAKKN